MGGMTKANPHARETPDASDEDGFSARQRQFVVEFTADHNGTQAAIRAGYSPRSAKQQASTLLSRPEIAEAVRKREADIANKIGITKQQVLDWARQAVEQSLAARPVLDKEGNETGQFEFQGMPAAKSVELLMKHLGMLDERLRVDHSGGLEVRLVGVDVEDLT